MDLDQIKELIGYLEGSKISKLLLKKGDLEICLEKEPSCFSSSQSLRTVVSENNFESGFPPEPLVKTERGAARREDVPGAYVTSPMVGTFYAASAPDQPFFVKVGDRVEPDTIVCIIEAMKVLNEVKAGISGVVTEVLIENSQPVEFGSRLFRIV